LILVIALIVFGPRKLPELGKSLGQAMAQFRRASEDFKRSWEQEVELEKSRKTESSSTESTSSYEPGAPWADGSERTESASAQSASSYSLPEETQPVESAYTETGTYSAEPETAAAATSTASEKPRSEHWI
jgi:TatA/E family protein of Tat protein translocase